jgi:hypothetical protein
MVTKQAEQKSFVVEPCGPPKTKGNGEENFTTVRAKKSGG